jgi:hypothetical protein
LVLGLVGYASGGYTASNPSPADGAECVDQNTVLTWSPGDGAVAHDVYFGIDYNSVNNATVGSPMGVYKGRQVSTTYSPGTLGACTTYYWRIDEVNVPIIVKGDVWHFKTGGGDCCRCISPPSNMAAWWPLDENDGDTSEEMVHNNDGTWMGSPTPVAGKVAGALDFNGVTDYVEVPDNAFLDFGTGDFSIDAWVTTSDACGTYAIVDKRSGPMMTMTGYVLFIYNGNLAFQWGFGAGNSTYLSSLLVADANWRHVAVTADRDDPCGLKLYVNGVSQAFNPTAQQGNLNNDGNLLIASDRYYNSHRFNGSIDEVELFNRALTAAEVNAIYAAGSAGKCKCEKAPTAFPDDIKWSQPPVGGDETGCINGWDENSIYNTGPIIADDWVCKDNRPITDIHWWGSFKGWTGDVLPNDKPTAFHIGIWTDVRDPNRANPNDFSHPGKLVWENVCSSYVWSYAGCDVDPRGIDQNETCFKFDQLLSQDQWFYQDSNEPNGRTIYWLSIAAIYEGNMPAHMWGWKTRQHFYNDDAIRIFPPDGNCPNSCPDPNLSVFQGGIADNFNLPAEKAFLSSDLLTYIGGATHRNFDETVYNQRFGYTFTGLPDCIVAATLEISMKATGDIPSTDSIVLGLTPGSPPKGVWSRLLKNLPLNPGWPAIGSWEIGDQNIFTLDLGNLLPYGAVTSVLDIMNLTNKLDIYIQDDTAVDYMILRVWSCPRGIGQWPPAVGSFWANGQPIKYPTSVSWDTAFVLTTNRSYSLRTCQSIIPGDLNGDCTVNFGDFAIMAGEWLTEGEVWPEFDLP